MSSVQTKIDYEYKVSGATQASSEMEKVGEGAQVSALGLAAATAAAVMATKAFVDMTVELAGTGAALFNAASAANVTVEDMQALNYVLLQTTGQTDAAGNSLRTINNFLLSAGEGAKRQTDALAAMNLEYSDLIAMNPSERFKTMTDAIGGMTDATEQNLAATAVFGTRYATQIVAALNQTDGSMRNMMDTFNDSSMALGGEHVTALKSYDDALTDIELQMTALKGTIAAEVAPEMEELMGIVQELIPLFAEELKEAIPAVKQVITDLGENIRTYGPVILEFTGMLIEAITKMEEVNQRFVTFGRVVQAVGTAGMSEAIRGRGELMEAERLLNEQSEILDETWLESFSTLQAGTAQSMTGWAGITDKITEATTALAGYASEYATETGGGSGRVAAQEEIVELLNEETLLEESLAIKRLAALEAEMQLKDTMFAKGMERRQMELEQVNAQMEPLISAAQRSTDIIVGGLTGGFDSIKDGFKNMLQDLAKEWAKSQIMKLLFSGGAKAATGGAGFFI